MTWRKVVLFFSDVELPDAWDMYFLARFSPVLRLPVVGMALVLPLAAIGAWAGWRQRREVRLLAGFVAVYAVSVCLFFVVFTGAIIYAAAQKKSLCKTMSSLPLEDGERTAAPCKQSNGLTT